MANAWKPWHEIVKIREDLKTGELSLASFAADLYDVAMQRGRRPIYEKPDEFFTLTYPTHNIREMAKDVAQRLYGENEKAVRQLELTYGGGKTHTLITFYHLFTDPEKLPDLPAVREFTSHIGKQPPQARVAVVSFDHLDVETGMEVRGPDGSMRQLKHPWSVLAYSLAGDDGLRIMHAEGEAEERQSPPAVNTLETLLRKPQEEGRATLILLDEVLMYARVKVGFDGRWHDRIVDFFQYLTQAVTKVDQCCVVASLLASDPKKYDQLGKELERDLANIFRREQEETVKPVEKADVAEVLRRRFFTTASIRDREAFRSHIVAALKGVRDLDEETKKQGSQAEERYLRSYPFHPDLTEVLYSKWTNLEGFQRTRGVLRTFALAIREADQWDESPLISANIFLGKQGGTELSKAARELTNVAQQEEYEGQRQNWTGILEQELAKARTVQEEFPGLKHREVEQMMFGIFLHSQPKGQRALTPDLLRLIGHTRPDKIELEAALRRLIEVSWFLDEEFFPQEKQQVPKQWRLGSKPNLTQMHHEACQRVKELIEPKLLEEIRKVNSLREGAKGAGVKHVHFLPPKVEDVSDDGDFHYAVLGPDAASVPGKPSKVAVRFLKEKTASGAPRTNPNAVVLAVPSPDGLEAARNQVRDYLGWVEVQHQLKGKDTDPIRDQRLRNDLDAAKGKIPERIRQAYSIVVTVDAGGQPTAFKVSVGSDPLFLQIKNHPDARIQETAITPEAILPGGPYDLWREDEEARRVQVLAGAFAARPDLPKMLRRKAILDTIADGCENGTFVLRQARPDKSIKTYWRTRPDETVMQDAGLEAVLPAKAELAELSPSLLSPGTLPGLWIQKPVTVQNLYDYFSGDHVEEVDRGSYVETISIPKAEKQVVDAAINAAVQTGLLWLCNGLASIYQEPIPAGLLTADATLQGPPEPILTTDLLPPNLPDAWADGETTALSISTALSKKHGVPLPWKTVSDALSGAFNTGLMERTVDSSPWPTDAAGAKHVKINLPTGLEIIPVPPVPPPGVRVAVAELTMHEIQNLADEISEMMTVAAGCNLKFHFRLEIGEGAKVPDDVVARLDELLSQVSDMLRFDQGK